jgi:hypothetical protein
VGLPQPNHGVAVSGIDHVQIPASAKRPTCAGHDQRPKVIHLAERGEDLDELLVHEGAYRVQFVRAGKGHAHNVLLVQLELERFVFVAQQRFRSRHRVLPSFP